MNIEFSYANFKWTDRSSAARAFGGCLGRSQVDTIRVHPDGPDVPAFDRDVFFRCEPGQAWLKEKGVVLSDLLS